MVYLSNSIAFCIDKVQNNAKFKWTHKLISKNWICFKGLKLVGGGYVLDSAT